MDAATENLLDSNINSIAEYMKNTSASGKSDKVKDDTYGEAQKLWNEFRQNLDSAKFNFHLDREQFEYLMGLLRNKFEYDVNAVFYILELANTLGEMEGHGKKGFKENPYIGFKLNATDVTYLYHILSSYKVKGLNRGTVLFANVIRRIGEISKIFDYYNNITKDLSKDIVDWVASFDAEVTQEPKVLKEPKKKSEKAN